jgi:hypothetical protein
MNPDPEVRAQRTRRTFTLAQREAILAEYDACENAGDRATVIRKHAIYSSHLANWRKQLANVQPPKKRGRPANPLTAELQKLRDENARLERRAAKAEKMVDALGKAHALLQMIASESATDDERSKKS